jgi:hypothetical protein
MQCSQLSLCLSAPTYSVPLHLQLSFLPQRFLSQHNGCSISLSLYYLWSAFLIVSLQQASCCIASYTMRKALRIYMVHRRSGLHSHNDIVMWLALWICHICQPKVGSVSFVEHWLLLFVLTVSLGEMMDAARYRQYGGKLCLSCQGWYVESNWTKQNLAFDYQTNSNSHANHTKSLDCHHQMYVLSGGLFEANISRHP